MRIHIQANFKTANLFHTGWQWLASCKPETDTTHYLIKAKDDNIILILLNHVTLSSWIKDNCQINMTRRLVAFIIREKNSLFSPLNWTLSRSRSLSLLLSFSFNHSTKLNAKQSKILIRGFIWTMQMRCVRMCGCVKFDMTARLYSLSENTFLFWCFDNNVHKFENFFGF